MNTSINFFPQNFSKHMLHEQDHTQCEAKQRRLVKTRINNYEVELIGEKQMQITTDN